MIEISRSRNVNGGNVNNNTRRQCQADKSSAKILGYLDIIAY